jgi:hypothetical protein
VRHLDWGHISAELADILHTTVKAHQRQQHADLIFRFAPD